MNYKSAQNYILFNNLLCLVIAGISLIIGIIITIGTKNVLLIIPSILVFVLFVGLANWINKKNIFSMLAFSLFLLLCIITASIAEWHYCQNHLVGPVAIISWLLDTIFTMSPIYLLFQGIRATLLFRKYKGKSW